MPYLALADEIFEGAGDVLHRHIRINAVLIKQIDAVGLEVAASNSRAPGPTDQSHPGTASSSAATLT
jgi:hypothetical protein